MTTQDDQPEEIIVNNNAEDYRVNFETQNVPDDVLEEELRQEQQEDQTIEMKTAPVKEIDTKIRIFLQQVGLEVMVKALEDRSIFLGETEFKARLETPESYENILASAINDYSNESARVLKSIAQIEDLSLFLPKLVKDGKTILSSTLSPRRPSSNGKSLSGQEARIEFAIKTGQAKRVILYNSGFTVDIESPNLTALNNFFTKAFDSTNAYGREFGANFFYFNNLLIKEALIEFLMPLILSCSLKNWNRGDTFIRNLKLTDLRTILNTIASLMYPDGFAFTHICSNPKCTNHEELLIDISSLFHHNFMLLSNENIDHIKRHDIVSQEQVENYQDSLGFTKSLRYGNLEFELKVPSMSDYLNYGKKFNADLLKSTFADNSTDVYQFLVFSYYQIYTPYIKTVILYDDKNEKDITSADPDVIAHQLSRLQESDKNQKFIEDINKYVAASEITHICYPAAPCQKCGHLPSDTGYHVVDPEHTFFTQVLKKLTPG